MVNGPTLRRPPDANGRATEPGAAQFRIATVLLERLQDLVTLLVGAALLALSGALLISAIIAFFRSHGSILSRGTGFLDEVLLVLILVEVVHTVMLSLRSHTLEPEPFIVVALIAAIRKLLFVLGNQQHLSTAQFSLFLATAVVFIGALVVVRRWGAARADGEEEHH